MNDGGHGDNGDDGGDGDHGNNFVVDEICLNLVG